MRPRKPPPAGDASREVAALIANLRKTGQRLEELTSDEVDSVLDGEGRTLLLRGVQQQLINVEAVRQAAILNALPAHVAQLDTAGIIVSVNDAWRRFSGVNRLQGPGCAVGLNYLAICDGVRGEGSSEAHQAAAGIRSVLRRGSKSFSIEYPCHSPSEKSWFQMTVTPVSGDHPGGAVVAHLDITARMESTENMRRFRAAMDISADAIVLLDRASMRYLDVNQTFCARLGYTREEVIGRTPMELFGVDRQVLERDYDALIADDGSALRQVVSHFRHKDGSLTPTETRRRALHTNEGWIIAAIARDITDRREAENRIAYLNRVYAVLSGINTLIVRARDRDELFRDACRVAVEAGGFRMAWICIVDPGTKKFVPVASVGVDEELLTAISNGFASGDEETMGSPMSALALRQRKAAVANDTLSDPRVMFGKKYAERGMRSMAVLPLMAGNEAVGVFVLNAGEAEFFHSEEMKLLTELAGDISFAIDHIAREAKRKEAEARVLRLNRVYAVLSGINTLIVRARDRDELLRESCRIAVEHGKFIIASISVVDREAMEVRPVAWAGASEEQYLAAVKPRLSLRENTTEGRGRTAQAIRQKKPVVINDTARDPQFLRKKEIAGHGISSVAILPLLVSNEVVGIVALFAAEAGFFDDEEMKLLTELAGDISFALEQIEKDERLDALAAEKSRADEALQRQQTELRALFDLVPAMIWFKDTQNGILRVNSRVAEAAGKTVLEIEGKPSAEIYPLDAEKFYADDLEVMRSGVPKLGYVEPLRGTDGRDMWVQTDKVPYFGQDGKVIGIVVMAQDITERKRSEERLATSEHRLDLALESGQLGAWELDLIHDTSWRTLRHDQIFGHASLLPEWGRETFLRQCMPKDRDRIGRCFDEAMRTDRLVFECQIIWPDQSRHWIHVLGHVYRDDKARPVRMAGTVMDITERKRGENELQRFREAMDSSGDGIFLVDRASLRYIDVNQTLCDLFGYSRQEMVGKTPMELFGADRDALERDYDTIIADTTGRAFVAEGNYAHRNGSLIPNETRRRAFHADGGWVIVGSARDISERKKAESRILYLNRVLSVLSGINTLIVRVRDPDELFKEACRIAVEEGGFAIAWLGIVDYSAMKVDLAASAGLNEELQTRIRNHVGSSVPPPFGNTATAQAIRERIPVVAGDLRGDRRFAFGGKLSEAGVRSAAVLPLIVSDKAVGVLALYASETEFFHAEEMRLLTELAGDIAFAIDHLAKDAQRQAAEAKVQRLNRVYAVLSGINTLIVRVRDRDELLKGACRIAVEEGGFPLASMGVVDRDAMKIVPNASAGKDEGFIEAVQRRMSLKDDSPEGYGMLATAVREKRAVIVNNVETSPLLGPYLAVHAERGFRSILALPMLIAGEPVAVLALHASEAGFFDDEEMGLLGEMASNIAFAIDNLDKKERLDYLAYYDLLTGLANRGLFVDRVAQHIRGAEAGGHGLGVFLIDLERFKNINDSLGQPAGDAILRQTAERLSLDAGGASYVARMGADQFAVVMPMVKPDGDLARLIEKWAANFVERPFHLNDAIVRIAIKLGAALYPDHGADAGTLLRNAEAALKKAKATGERYLFYTQNMNEAVAVKLSLENQLRQALDRNEFVLHYQPKVRLAGSKLTSAEALIRWNDPRTGLVPPGRFIPVLEETGLINEVGRWALRKAIDDYLRWRNAGLPAVRIAVNVSPLQLRHRGFVAEIEQVIGVDPHAAEGLELEITESLIMQDVKHSIASLTAIRAMGASVAIDDFGTGFSSLSYLARLPVDTLKIDRSFVIDMTGGPEGLALVSTIIGLAHSLSLKVVAEGVETAEQSRLLHLLRCDEMQGFLFSKPVSADIFEAKFLAPPSPG
jgi:diguanylate cyclase (GGDEF)-like protein/PAS domain S-box-containing protein